MNVVPLQQPESEPDTFADFWCLYPRHEAKKDARRAWAKIPAAQHVLILTALVDWRPVWRDKDVQFICLPATYLRGERWEDELPPEYRNGHASHIPMSTTAPTERTAMPESVRQMIAKLRGKA